MRRNACGSMARTIWPSRMAGPNQAEFMPLRSASRRSLSPSRRGTRSWTSWRPISTSRPYSTPDGQVVSQLRQVRQRSRCCWVAWVGSLPSSSCLIR
ncbi:Uncharacterised protein [Bordetella pertussis]|nr:Uncharacterised protein [Bordetella pertussis]